MSRKLTKEEAYAHRLVEVFIPRGKTYLKSYYDDVKAIVDEIVAAKELPKKE